MDYYQSVAAGIDAKRKRQPIAHALLDAIYDAIGRASGERKEALMIRAVGISAEVARTWADMTHEQAVAEMGAIGL